MPIVLAHLPVQSAVDVGCGRGAWLCALQEHNVSELAGYDGEHIEESELLLKFDFQTADLSGGFRIERRFDLALSLEVAEHLPERAAKKFVQSLTAAAPAVLFSAAVPGQAGIRHVNLQWQDYWRDLFRPFGFQAVDLVRPKIWGHPNVDFWYQQNTILYCSNPVLQQNALLRPVPDRVSLNVVHPALYESLLSNSNLHLSAILKLLPSMVKKAVRFRLQRGWR